MKQKTLSVLIPTYGRSKELLETIELLMKQSRLPDEIIVVDQNNPSFSEVNQYLSKIPIINHIHAKTPGVSVNYNRCLKHAKSEIVLFLDDDIKPEMNLIENHIKNYELDPSIAGVAGRVEQPSGDRPPEQIKKVGSYSKWTGKLTADFNAIQRTQVQVSPGGNMSFDRKLLLQVQGFDAGFDGNGFYFETDGSLRLTHLGYRIVFDPDASLKHLMAPSGGARITDKARHTFFYVKNGIRLYRRHGFKLGLPIYLIKMLGYTFLKALYNHNLQILKEGLHGLFIGLKQDMKLHSEGLITEHESLTSA